MPLDPSIPLQVRPVNIDMAQLSPMNTMLGAMKLRQLEQEGSLNAMTLAERKGVKEYLASGADISKPDVKYKLASEFGDFGRKIAETGASIGKAATEEQTRRTALTASKTLQYRDALQNVDTREEALSWIQQQQEDPDMAGSPIAKVSMMDAARKIPADPAGFSQWKQQATLGLTKYTEMNAPKFISQDKGATGGITAVPGMGGGPATTVPGSEFTKTMTPGETEANRIRQEAVNVSKGQLRVAQQRLEAEAATGTLSPESQELAANLYLQTGMLPPMGIGKGAAGLKASIMNRASEIASGTGATSEEAATGMVQAKQNVATQTKTLKDFSTGIQGQMVTSFNTAIDHLSTVDKLADALNNGDVRAINSIGNVISKQTGSPAPTNFDAARQIVGAEIQKAIIRAGGTGKEREEAANAFNSANSPSQLKGVIETYKQLLGGQLNSLEMQYTANSGRKDFSSKLSPAAKDTVKKLRGEGGASATGVDTSNPLLR